MSCGALSTRALSWEGQAGFGWMESGWRQHSNEVMAYAKEEGGREAVRETALLEFRALRKRLQVSS